jgi:hypothetical protein
MVRDTRRLQIPLLITVGSPLGIRAVRDQFRPLRYPPVDGWYNAFDPRDVVALYPLDGENFPFNRRSRTTAPSEITRTIGMGLSAILTTPMSRCGS